MKKIALSILVMTIAASASFAQTSKPKMEEAKSNPRTTENAARADAQQVNKNNVSDSATIKINAIKRKENPRKVKGKKTNHSAS